MKNKVTVVIPLYNQGQYIDETLKSVLSQTYKNIEIIIVNDGSTDYFTITKIAELEQNGFNFVHKVNGGLSSARNAGIAKANGKYIITLDSDDLIHKTYVAKLVNEIERSNAKIVYSRALLFGERSGLWMLPKYSIHRMLHGNIVFCSAIYHRSDWELTGGYDESMKDGLEDWDFWLSIIERGGKVLRVEEPLFFYRIRKESMLRSLDVQKKQSIANYIYRKHNEFFLKKSVNLESIHIEKKENIIHRIAKKIISMSFGVLYARYYYFK